MNILEILRDLKKRLKEVSSQWNGDESGLLEDRSNLAEEGVNKINGLKNILEELNIL